MKNRLWGQNVRFGPRLTRELPYSRTLPCEPLTTDESAAHHKRVLTYLIGLRTRWERGEPLSLSMLTGVYTDQVFRSMILTCEDADAHLFSAPLHSLIAYCEQQLAEN
jgi:hypothetical protein